MDKLRELEFKDIDKDLEKRLRRSSKPRFLINFQTPGQKFIGILELYEEYMWFRPLNQNHRGEFDYKDKELKLEENEIFEVKMPYSEIFEELMIIPTPGIPDPKKQQTPIDFSLQVQVYKTGFFPYASPFQKEQILDFKKSKIPIASFTLKICNIDLCFRPLNNNSREEVVEDLQRQITKRLPSNIPETQKPEIPINLSTFDINYDDLFGLDYTHAKNRLDIVTKELDLLKNIFGFRNLQHIRKIHNQSLFDIGSSFPTLLTKKQEEVGLRKNGFLSFVGGSIDELLQQPSAIISHDGAEMVSSFLLNYTS